MNRDEDVNDEIRAHLEMARQDRVDRGEDPVQAAANARREFGNVLQIEEKTREVWTWRPAEELAQDIRFGIRQLLQSPLFALVAIASLALGIGANTALFSVAHTLLLKDLPYRDGDRLAYVTEYWPHEPVNPGPPSPDYTNWRANSHLNDGIAAYSGVQFSLTLTGIGEPERIPGTMVTHELLDLLGVQMAAGRNFTPDEDRAHAEPVVILSNRLWLRKFGAADVIGKVAAFDGVGRRIVGVLPAGFVFPDNNFRDEMLVPMELPPNLSWRGGQYFRLVRVMVRLKQGVSSRTLRDEFVTLLQRTSSDEPPRYVTARRDMEVRVTPLREWLTGNVRTSVLVLEGAVAMLLLIACLNIASLQVARVIARRKEFALRLAIGAGKGRLLRQFLTESLLISGLAGAVGVLIAYLGLGGLRGYLPANLHLADTVRLNGPVLLSSLAITLLAGLVIGLVPAIAATRQEINETLKETGRSTESRGQQWLHGILVASQVAAAMVLLIGSGLLIRVFLAKALADPGFDPRRVLTMRIAPSPRTYPDNAKRALFYQQVLEQMQTIPGVESAAIGSGLPIIEKSGSAEISFQDRQETPGSHPSLPAAVVSANYFKALGIPLLRGRFMNDADRTGPPVALVNQAFASEFYPGQIALGRRVGFAAANGPWMEIVGVVGNVRNQGKRPVDPFLIYFPLRAGQATEAFLILKSILPRRELLMAAKKVVETINPNQVVFDVATMDERVSESLSTQRANMTMMGMFAALALLLAAIGIFGVIAYFVNRRLQEIGIRMALGATSGDILQMVLGRGMALAGVGILTGLAGALTLSRTLGSMIEGVQSHDPAAYLGAVALFAAVAAGACFLPARRASKADPMGLLRHD